MSATNLSALPPGVRARVKDLPKTGATFVRLREMGLLAGTVATLTFLPALYAWSMATAPRTARSLDPDDPLSPRHDHASA